MSEVVNQSLQKIAKAFVGKWVKSIKMRKYMLRITHHRLRITNLTPTQIGDCNV